MTQFPHPTGDARVAARLDQVAEVRCLAQAFFEERPGGLAVRQ
jgi:hypothetical protein